MKRTLHVAAHRYVSILSAVSALVVPVATARGQVERPESQKPAVPSFSNGRGARQAKPGGSNIATEVASEQAAADATAADALSRIYDIANNRFWDHGEYNHVVNLNQVVMEGDPGNLDTYCNNAWLLWSTDRKEMALVALKKGLAANPKTYYMYDEIANYYRIDLHDYPSALPYFEQATKFACPSMTWHGLALCYEKAGKWEKAVNAWSNACRDPKDGLAIVRMKRAQAHLDKQQGSGR